MKKRSGKNTAMRTPSKSKHPALNQVRKKREEKPPPPPGRMQLLRNYLEKTKPGTAEARAALDAILTHDNAARRP